LVLTFATAARASDSKEARARALTLFKESAAHYEAGRYAVAAALLEEAYALHPEPKLLYNLGRAREAAGDPSGAVEAYEGFLHAEPATGRRAQIEERIERLKAQIPDEPPPPVVSPMTTDPSEDATQPASPATEATSTVAPTDAEPPSRGGPPRIIPWSLLGAGVALLGTAATVGIIARREHRSADEEPVQAEAAKLQHAAERKALTANVLLGAGGALAVAGGTWLLFTRNRDAGKRSRRGAARAVSLRVGLSRVDCIVSF
jgi:tetratricopeptide (TPR) repeat protein